MKVLFFLSCLVLLVTDCNTGKTNTNQETTPQETTSEDGQWPTLTVTDIEHGKDGYTASLKDAKKGLYTMVVSIPNLEDNYVDLKVGDRVRVDGEYAESHPIQIFPKRIELLTKDSTIRRITIASAKADCTGVAPQKCLLIKEEGDSSWTYFYDGIEGFSYEAGYEYVLQVREEAVENPPADGSSIRTILIKQISKTQKTSEKMPE